MAQLPGEGWKHFQTLSDLFEKAELKGQVAHRQVAHRHCKAGETCPEAVAIETFL